MALAVHDAVEGCLDVGKVQFCPRERHFGVGLCQFGLFQRDLLVRDNSFLRQVFGVIEFDLNPFGLGGLGVQLGLVKSGQDFEHQIPLLHGLAFFDTDLVKIPALQGSDVDVLTRVDLADVLLRADHGLSGRTGDQNLVIVVFRFFMTFSVRFPG